MTKDQATDLACECHPGETMIQLAHRLLTERNEAKHDLKMAQQEIDMQIILRKREAQSNGKA